MLNPSDYTSPQNIWNGISHYAQDHFDKYQDHLPASFTDDDLLKALKKSADKRLLPKEYDTFRKAVTALRNGTAATLKHENLYRLCFVLNLDSDSEAQSLFSYYLHCNELSARSLDEFIILSSLKLQLSWEETCKIRGKYHEQIQEQPISPSNLCEGQTAKIYQQIIHDKIQTINDLWDFLNAPENMNFFATTRNTQYLALFDDVELEILYNGNCEQIIRLVTNYGNLEKEPILEYYHSLFGLQWGDNDRLTDKEISSLSSIFENVFMNYNNFLLLVQRKRLTDISSGTFMLSLLKKLLTEDSEKDNDFYMNFLEEDEFIEICDDIRIAFGFPTLNPECDNFDRLLLDVYQETLKEHSDLSNCDFQNVYIHSLRNYLRLIANL